MTPRDPTSPWPLGESEMARRVRGHDWAATPLGAVEGWSERLRGVVDLILASREAMFVAAGPELVLIYNDAYVPFLGTKHPGALGARFRPSFEEVWDRIGPLVEETLAGRQQAMADQRFDLPWRPEAPEGWFALTWTPLHDAEGVVSGFLAWLRETTEVLRLQAASRESEARLLAAFESVPVGVAVMDGSGAALVSNAEFRRFLPTGVIPSRDPARLGRWRGWDAQGRPLEPQDFPGARALRGERVVPGQEMIYTDDDGREVWTSVSNVPIRDEAGRVTGLATVVTDIDAVKRSVDALRESEARFRALVTAGTYMTYRMSPDWSEMLELRGQGVLSDTGAPASAWAASYILPEDEPMVAAAVAEAIRTKSLFELEHRVRRADGSVGWVVSRAVPILGEDGEIREWFGAGSDVTARREAQERLREMEERYRADLERQVEERTAELQASRDLLQGTMDSSLDMIQVFEAVRDEAGGIVDFRWVLNNHTSERIYGRVEGESLLQRNPGVVVEGIFDAFRRVTETGLPDQAERHYVHEQFDGWFLQSVVKLGDGVATTTKEITDWKRAQEEVLRLTEEVAQARLREREEQLRGFGEASSDVLWIRDADTLDWTYLSPAFEAIYGLSREEALSGDTFGNWLDLILPEDRERARAEIGKARQGERVVFEYRIRRPVDGEVRLLRNTDFPIRDAAGRVTHIGGVGHDATEEQATAERLKVLVMELQHRTRNLMGVVRGVTDKTLAGSTSLRDFQGRIRDRLGALARVNGLLSRLTEGDRICIDELIRSELSGHGVIDGSDHGPQVDLRGPKGIRLRSSTVQTLALGLHELATNALKYGALSQPEGRLDVAWSLVPGPDGQRRLRVEWRESGVAVADPDGSPAEGSLDGTPPRRRGFGRELIERALPYQLGAETAYEITPEGVRCTITLPLSSTQGEGGSSREGMDD